MGQTLRMTALVPSGAQDGGARASTTQLAPGPRFA